MPRARSDPQIFFLYFGSSLTGYQETVDGEYRGYHTEFEEAVNLCLRNVTYVQNLSKNGLQKGPTSKNCVGDRTSRLPCSFMPGDVEKAEFYYFQKCYCSLQGAQKLNSKKKQSLHLENGNKTVNHINTFLIVFKAAPH